MNNTLKVILITVSLLIFSQLSLKADGKIFTKEEITNIADGYVHNNLGLKNPAIVDVDNDGKLDILIFKDGNVEYYRNTGTLEKPFFVLENKHYDSYKSAAVFFDVKMPYPIFFADASGDGKPDMFIVKNEQYNQQTQKMEYEVSYEKNVMDLDTGTLITIILVLLIVVLVIAIVHK